MKTNIPYILEIDNQEIVIVPDPAHEFTATTEQVALGYSVTADNIRKHKETKKEELIEGKHWFAVSNTHAAGTVTLWTKRGIIRLGFFIRSARARKFRDMAEDLVLGDLEKIILPSTTTPLLISARLIAASTGQSRSGVALMLKRHGVLPTHHFLEPLCHSPAYLWPLKEIEAFYAGWELPSDFVPFTGESLLGVAPVQRMFTTAKRAGNKRKPLPNSKAQAQQPLFFSEVERIGAQMGAAIAKCLTEEFIRDELPDRIRAEMTRRISA